MKSYELLKLIRHAVNAGLDPELFVKEGKGELTKAESRHLKVLGNYSKF